MLAVVYNGFQRKELLIKVICQWHHALISFIFLPVLYLVTSICIHLYSAIGQQQFLHYFKKIIIELSVVIKISSFSHFLQKKLHKYYGYVIQLWHP